MARVRVSKADEAAALRFFGMPAEDVQQRDGLRMPTWSAWALTSGFVRPRLLQVAYGTSLVVVSAASMVGSRQLEEGSWWRSFLVSAGVAVAAYAVFTLLIRRIADGKAGWYSVTMLSLGGLIATVLSNRSLTGWPQDVVLEVGVALLLLALIEMGVGAVIAESARRQPRSRR